MSVDRRLILLTVKENISLTALDAETGATVACVEVGTLKTGKPHELAISNDGTRGFISLYGSADYGPNVPDNRIAVVDLTDMTLAGHIDLNLYKGPHALIVDRDGKLWTTVDHSRCVLVIDPDSWEIEHTIWLQTPGHFLAASPDGRTLYASSKEYPVITEIDIETRTITARIDVPVGAQAIRVSNDGSRLFVGDFHRPLLHVIDCAARTLIATHPLTGVPGWPFVSPDGKTVAVTTFDEPNEKGFVELLNADDPDGRRVVEVADEPFHALFSDDSRYLHAALANGEVPKIDVATAEIVDGGYHAGGSMPEAIVAYDGAAA
ncbi:MAG: YncE family protein [Alphaproteobacteria bacterium]